MHVRLRRRLPPGSSRGARLVAARPAFTIIELLVSMGLVILIMAVMAQAFTVGLDTFSKLKAIGDMSDRLRAATHQIRGDLASDHFGGSIRLSDPDITINQPREGYFAIKQFGPSLPEGFSDGVIPSFRAPAADGQSHVLHMTCKLRGNRKQNFFGATVPATSSPLLTQSTTFFNHPPEARHQDTPNRIYTTQWAEVAYFLQPLLDDAGNRDRANFTLPLYSLHRVIKVLVADNRTVNSQVPVSQINGHGGFSCRAGGGGNVHFNSPRDVTVAADRYFTFAEDPTAPGAASLAGVNTLLLTDVVSFTVQIIPAVPLPSPNPPPFGYPIAQTEFVDVGTVIPTGVYDSSSAPVGLLAVQVTIRVWDRRTQQTRQISLIQDM